MRRQEGDRPHGRVWKWALKKIVCCPSLDSVPEAVHASERRGVWSEEVGPIGENGEEEAVGNTVA